MPTIHLQIYDGTECVETITAEGEVECGRQDPHSGDPEPIALNTSDGRNRLVLIPASDKRYSRRWFSVDCSETGEITLNNLHTVHEIKLNDGHQIAAGESETFARDITINLGDARCMRVGAEVELSYRMLESIPYIPGSLPAIDATLSVGQIASTDGGAVVDLLKIALEVIQQASGSDAFFQAAAQAAVSIVGLDRATIMVKDHRFGPGAACVVDPDAEKCETNSPWSTASEYRAEGVDPRTAPPVSRTVLEQVVSDCRTQIHDPDNRSFEAAHSATNVHSIVASPVIDSDGKAIGVLYGDRWSGKSAGGDRFISDLEGTFAEVLAGAVASGIARQQQEQRRNNLSSFFSPRVAELLEKNPDLLRGHDATVTVLFCDVRGFSSVTEKLGAQKTIQWINDVLTELSQCVHDRDGVLVDYVGDELMAMWGAPDEQPDHATRAVEAAVAMLEAIEVLRSRWTDRLPQRFGAGIGINTGDARVGNVGSDLKFKYGVLGNTVNGGSRLQAATKQLGVDCLISDRTTEFAKYREQARRLAKLQVVGIQQPIDVFEIVREPTDQWQQLRSDYESALNDYEAMQFAEATGKLAALVQSHPDDRPARMLLTKAVTQIDQPDPDFSPVWVLTKK